MGCCIDFVYFVVLIMNYNGMDGFEFGMGNIKIDVVVLVGEL